MSYTYNPFTGQLDAIGVSAPNAGTDVRYLPRTNPSAIYSNYNSSVNAAGITYTSSATMSQLINMVSNAGIAQAGSLTSIMLASAASSSDGSYNGARINIIFGTGVGQTAICKQYTGATRTASLSAWTPTVGNTVVAPDTTSVYVVVPVNQVGIYGINQAFLAPFGLAGNAQYSLSGAAAVAATLTVPDLVFSFYHYASGATPGIDLKLYGNAQCLDLWVDDKYVGHYDTAIVTGTCVSGSTSTTMNLATSSSTTTGYYNQCYARITSGTGVLGEERLITAYNGTTFVATVNSAWTTTPDATTTYSIDQSPSGIALDGNTGSLKYLHIPYTADGTHKIRIVSPQLVGIVIGTNDSVSVGPLDSTTPIITLGDSYHQGTVGPANQPKLSELLARQLGLQKIHTGCVGGTGVNNANSGTGASLPFGDRLIPPGSIPQIPGDAQCAFINATGGTFTVSVTANGSTQTTGNLAYNVAPSAVLTAVAALSNLSSATVYATGLTQYPKPLIVVVHNPSGATITFNGGSLTGGSGLKQQRYMGDIINHVPLDANGKPTPFILFLPGSGNDRASGASLLQTTLATFLPYIPTVFPGAITVMTGIMSNTTDNGVGTLDTNDIAFQAAYAAAAAALPLINNKLPLLDTYSNGLNGRNIVYGAGSVGAPTNNQNDIFKSLIVTGHPTGDGGAQYANWIVPRLQKLFGVSS